METSATKPIKKRFTIADLQQAEETRKETIAKFYEELNKVEGEKREYKKLVMAASKAGSIDDAMKAQEAAAQCELRKSVIATVIEQASKEKTYTDADCIDAANFEIEQRTKELAELTDHFNKLAIEMTILARDMAILYQETQLKRNEALSYHGAMLDEKITNDSARQAIFAKQGLKSIQPIPDLHMIQRLLAKHYGTEAEAICNISTGAVIPSYGYNSSTTKATIRKAVK